MDQNIESNRRIVLASRPDGAPTKENFRLETSPKPVPKEGEILLRSIYLSLDPYMRRRMSDAPSYADPVETDDVMVGATVCQVEVSRHPNYQEGEWVLASTGWQVQPGEVYKPIPSHLLPKILKEQQGKAYRDNDIRFSQ